MSRAVWSTASASSYVACARESEAAAWTFWPTMMMLSNTNWRKVWLIHDTRVTAFLDWMASGSDTSASAANAYAHHIVPTASVILTARAAFQRATRGAVGGCTAASTTFGG